jgi:hypothetical protein
VFLNFYAVRTDASAKIRLQRGNYISLPQKRPRAIKHSGSCQCVGGPGYSRAGRQGVGVMGAAQCGLLEAALIQTLADLQQFKSLTGNSARVPVECGLVVACWIGKSWPSPSNLMPERIVREKRRGERVILAIAALLFSVSPAFSTENARVKHLDTLLDFVGFVTADCVQHYDQELKPDAVAKLHFSETEVAAYCVCSTKLLVGEMDEQMFKKLEAGKVGSVLMSLGAALKGIRYVCAKKVWDAKQKR